MKTIYYIKADMLSRIEQKENGCWAEYKGQIDGVLYYCGDYATEEKARKHKEKDGWKEVKSF